MTTLQNINLPCRSTRCSAWPKPSGWTALIGLKRQYRQRTCQKWPPTPAFSLAPPSYLLTIS
jgi:hypothetical protein